MGHPFRFLSIQAQDFIEENATTTCFILRREFLSIQAQDFIEENATTTCFILRREFLSIQAQDFIEESAAMVSRMVWPIPEHSSSGLH